MRDRVELEAGEIEFEAWEDVLASMVLPLPVIMVVNETTAAGRDYGGCFASVLGFSLPMRLIGRSARP